MTETATRGPLAVFGDEGWCRNRFHTRTGAQILNAVIEPLWDRFPPHGFGVITTVGRHSGARRRRPVRVIVTGHTAYLVAIVGESSDWLRNLRADPRVELRAAGVRSRGAARELRDETETRTATELYCGRVHRSDYVECFLHLRGRPSRRKIEQLHRRWFRMGTPMAIDIEPERCS